MRILIVETNDKTRLELFKSLNKEGYYVESVDNKSAAEKILKVSKFDFVLSNQDIPGLDRAEKLLGDPPMILYTVELTKIAKRFSSVLFMTSATLEGIKNHAMWVFNNSVEKNTQVANSI